MNNEPVAWMQSINKELPDGCECMQSVSFFKANDNDIPLYTHPADESFDRTASHMAGEYVSYPAKTLTDDEIAKLADDILGYQIYGYKESGVYEFARAILRKAQDK